jgi:hypothetical protein
LLPWLFSQHVRGATGRLPNHLGLIDRWKIFDNLRRSWQPPALLLLAANGGTLVRLFITRRGLLRWTTAASVARRYGAPTAAPYWRRMAAAPVLAGLIAAAIALFRPEALWVAAPFLLAWAVAPQAPLTAEQRQTLRALARRTWLYFEAFVGPEANWLPPDHRCSFRPRRTHRAGVGFFAGALTPNPSP